MELWDNDDYERPIESYPGYLGHALDGGINAQSELASLLDFDFRKYSELVDGCGGERHLNVVLPSGRIAISFNAYDGIVAILDQLPTVKVLLDNGPPDAGPASGGTYVFFIADGVSEAELDARVAAVAKTLKSDFNSLEKVARCTS